MRTNTIRFSGLASGLDTDSIVKDLMKVQQLKVDREKKSQALITLKQDAWKDMQKKLYNFHIKFTDKMRNTSTFSKTKVTNSNPDVLEIPINTTVLEGTHVINKVEQLAASAQVTSKQLMINGQPASKDKKISEITELRTSATETLKADDGSGIFKTKTQKFTVTDPKGTSKEIEITSDTTIGALEKELSEAMGGSNVRYDEKFGRFFISTKETGENQKITFSKVSGDDILSDLGFEDKEGQDAIIFYNNVEIRSESNNVTVNGIAINLKATTDTAVNISSTKDNEAIYNWAKEFITEYNKLLDELNEKLDTKPAKGIEPLTSEERSAMSESDIKLWEDKINSSLFYRDQQLADFVRTNRNIIGDVHKFPYAGVRTGENKERVYGESPLGEYNSLASLGIVTGSWQEKGKLHIHGDESDELYSGYTNKLKEAIEKDPDAVIALFTTIGAKLYEEHNDKLVTSNDIKSSMKFYNDKLMADKIKDYEKKIETLEDRMYKMENMYYAKFAAMEKMMSKMNNQSSWLSQQLGGY